jgi:CDP-diacylglycerol--serine O-phosphatidyltransferase
MATLGNAICGFAAIYIASLNFGTDPWTQMFMEGRFVWAAYLIFAAMVFDGIDGRLARFARHTTDFGAQLDSMADAVSFGVAPAILMLQVMKSGISADMPFALTRAIWGIGAVYMSCALIRLARFNVSNEHGEQHHFSFLGLPSPGAAGVVAAIVLMWHAALTNYMSLGNQMDTAGQLVWPKLLMVVFWIGTLSFWALPVLTLTVALLMVSTIRYPHVVNRLLRGRKTIPYFIGIILFCVSLLVFHQYIIGLAMVAYTLWGIGGYLLGRYRKSTGVTTTKA